MLNAWLRHVVPNQARVPVKLPAKFEPKAFHDGNYQHVNFWLLFFLQLA